MDPMAFDPEEWQLELIARLAKETPSAPHFTAGTRGGCVHVSVGETKFTFQKPGETPSEAMRRLMES